MKDRTVRKRRKRCVQLSRAITFSKPFSFSCNSLRDYNLEGTTMVGNVGRGETGAGEMCQWHDQSLIDWH